ncbi:MAG TPA: hypothetical protein VFU09_09025 [Candidatus Udaeobacter sp.]|nr:hypothetical protein [Candidatus Udaeobacter sp.]
MERDHATRLIGISGIAGAMLIVLALSIDQSHSAIPTIKVPGAYPYEETVRIAAPPPDPDSSALLLPTPAPYPYRDSLSPAAVRDSRIADARRPLTAKTVREAAFKYNGVPDFCGFLATLPADVSVFDPKLGKTRPLIKGGRVVPKNVAWLHKRKQARPKSNDRTLVSVEELEARHSGI